MTARFRTVDLPPEQFETRGDCVTTTNIHRLSGVSKQILRTVYRKVGPRAERLNYSTERDRRTNGIRLRVETRVNAVEAH